MSKHIHSRENLFFKKCIPHIEQPDELYQLSFLVFVLHTLKNFSFVVWKDFIIPNCITMELKTFSVCTHIQNL